MSLGYLYYSSVMMATVHG